MTHLIQPSFLVSCAERTNETVPEKPQLWRESGSTIKAAQMNRLIVEYKIKEWTECAQSLISREGIISRDEKLLGPRIPSTGVTGYRTPGFWGLRTTL